MNQNEQQNAVDRALEALPEFRRQDDYLLAHDASLMSDDSHEIIHIDTLTKIVRAALSAAPAQEPVGEPLTLDQRYWLDRRGDIIAALEAEGLQIWSDKDRVWLHRLSASPLPQEPVRMLTEREWLWLTDAHILSRSACEAVQRKFMEVNGLPASPLPQEPQEGKALRDALGKAEVGLANAKSYDGRVLPPKELASVAAALDEVRAALKATAGRAERELRGAQEGKELTDADAGLTAAWKVLHDETIPASNRYIRAIKAYREATGALLKESKDAVDDLQSGRVRPPSWREVRVAQEEKVLTEERILYYARHAADRIPASNYEGRVLHVVRCIERELRGAQEVKAGEWLPIESAPKEHGAEVLGWFRKVKLDEDDNLTDEVIGGAIAQVSRNGDGWTEPDWLDASGAYFLDDWSFEPEPVLWQPLPPPPSATLSASSKGERR